MLCCSHLLLLATRQLFVLAKTLFWALIVTTHLFVMDVQFLAFVSMGHDTYSAGAILLWAIHVPGYAVASLCMPITSLWCDRILWAICLCRPILLLCGSRAPIFWLLFHVCTATTVLPSSKRSFALLFPVYTRNTP